MFDSVTDGAARQIAVRVLIGHPELNALPRGSHPPRSDVAVYDQDGVEQLWGSVLACALGGRRVPASDGLHGRGFPAATNPRWCRAARSALGVALSTRTRAISHRYRVAQPKRRDRAFALDFGCVSERDSGVFDHTVGGRRSARFGPLAVAPRGQQASSEILGALVGSLDGSPQRCCATYTVDTLVDVTPTGVTHVSRVVGVAVERSPHTADVPRMASADNFFACERIRLVQIRPGFFVAGSASSLERNRAIVAVVVETDASCCPCRQRNERDEGCCFLPSRLRECTSCAATD